MANQKLNPLQEYMEKQGLEANQIAAKLDVSTATVYNWNKGKSIPSQKNMRGIVKLVNKDYNVLSLREQWIDWTEKEEE